MFYCCQAPRHRRLSQYALPYLFAVAACHLAAADEIKPYDVKVQRIEEPALRYVERQYHPGYSVLHADATAEHAVLALRAAYRALKNHDMSAYTALWVYQTTQAGAFNTAQWDEIIDVHLLREVLRGDGRIAVVQCLTASGASTQAAVTLRRQGDGRFLLSPGLAPSPANDYLNAHHVLSRQHDVACALPHPVP